MYNDFDDDDGGDVNISATLSRIERNAAERQAAFDEFLATQPASIQCERHPEVRREIDRERSELGRAVYLACNLCEAERTEQRRRRLLHSLGVPANLLHATFEQWHPRDESERAQLATVREFVKKRCGFLLLLGAIGVGKSHLAVGVRFQISNLLKSASTATSMSGR
jgi:DNA replication protein DnaC